jgi:hypothetical protein
MLVHAEMLKIVSERKFKPKAEGCRNKLNKIKKMRLILR